MLPVTAYLGYEHPVVWQALDHLESRFGILSLPIEQTVCEIEQHAVFLTSPGKYPGEFLKTLFALTADESKRREEQIRLRGYHIPPLALHSPYIILLKEPDGDEDTYAGEKLDRFLQAVEQACGFARPRTHVSASVAAQREREELETGKAKRRQRIRDEMGW